MILKDVLEKTAAFFRERGSPSARLDAELLLAHGLKIDRIRLYLEFDRPMKEEELSSLRDLVRRRGQGEPVAYLIGRKDFFGFSFEVGPGVLVPRPETEHLVETALEHLTGHEEPRIVDLGCGSGCVGLSLLQKIPTARLLAVEFSPVALEFARRNAELLCVSDRVTFFEGDAGRAETVEQGLRAASFEKCEAVLANPPYIAKDDANVEPAVKKFEPEQALFADHDGLSALTSWSEAWLPTLSARGLMAMEMGFDQGAAMLAHFQKLGLSASIVRDLAGHDRVMRGLHG